MTEQHFIDVTSAEETVRHLFDTTRVQVILVSSTPERTAVLTDLDGEDLAATLLALDGDIIVYAHQYGNRRNPWYTPDRKRARHVYKHILRQTDRLSARIPLRIDGLLDTDFRQQDLFAHALFYTAFRLRVFIQRDALAYTLTLTQPSADEWAAAPGGSVLYTVAQNSYLGAVSHYYVSRKDDAQPLNIQ